MYLEKGYEAAKQIAKEEKAYDYLIKLFEDLADREDKKYRVFFIKENCGDHELSRQEKEQLNVVFQQIEKAEKVLKSFRFESPYNLGKEISRTYEIKLWKKRMKIVRKYRKLIGIYEEAKELLRGFKDHSRYLFRAYVYVLYRCQFLYEIKKSFYISDKNLLKKSEQNYEELWMQLEKAPSSWLDHGELIQLYLVLFPLFPFEDDRKSYVRKLLTKLEMLIKKRKPVHRYLQKKAYDDLLKYMVMCYRYILDRHDGRQTEVSLEILKTKGAVFHFDFILYLIMCAVKCNSFSLDFVRMCYLLTLENGFLELYFGEDTDL